MLPGGDHAPERELARLLAGTEQSRRARADEALGLLDRVQAGRLIGLLDRLNVTVLFGQRLLALGAGEDARLEEAVSARMTAARETGTMHELVTLGVLAGLERGGIRALALKGSALARQLYDDVGARSAGDVDILVATEDLLGAIAIVGDLGWRSNSRRSPAAPLPLLHETLTHPELPRLELHWRVHWYETRFAADALQRASRPGPGAPLRMDAQDGLAALVLFYVRDGLAGLRMAADVAAWWDEVCGERDCDLVAVADRYPSLAAPLMVGSAVLAQLVGVPGAALDQAPLRWRLAAELAAPFHDRGLAQLKANVSLVDLLLAPPGESRDAVRREASKPLEGAAFTRGRGVEAWERLRRLEHMLRVMRRWVIAVVLAAGRLARRRRLTSGA
jgi:hypothetical protein